MKKYLNKNKTIKWYKKIDFVWLFITTISVLVGTFLIFYFIGKGSNLSIAIKNSIIISFIIMINIILVNLLENRTTLYIFDKKIKYLQLHDAGDGKFLTDEDFNEVVNSSKPLDIYENIDKYEGIDCGEIIKILKIKKRSNKIVLVAEVNSKEWKLKGRFSSDLVLINKNYRKKFIIPNDYENYDELYENLLKHKD